MIEVHVDFAIAAKVAGTNQNPLTITQAMGLISVGSPATIGKNRRTKHVHPTNKAETYFSALGKCLSEAAKIQWVRLLSNFNTMYIM